jgi:TolB-like protein
MFTDIVGYTALMGEDEKHALSVLEENRKIHRKAIKKHNGRWLKEIGDGILISFHSAIEAVNCALEIRYEAIKTEDYNIRIAIHQGDVVFEEGDVYGDGVNIASRIESLTPPDKIYVSEAVYYNVHNHKGIHCDYIKEEHLKNVKHPVKIYNIRADDSLLQEILIKKNKEPEKKIFSPNRFLKIFLGILIIATIGLITYRLVIKQTLSDRLLNNEKSIAVMAFEDLSPTGDQEYLGDGISEEIINTLAKFENLKVIARTSSFQFKGEKVDIREVGQKLQVNSILEGSVISANGKIRITAQLIDVRDGTHIWSEKYDYNMTDIFSIQDRIAEAISSKFQLASSGDKGNKIITTSTAAYNQYFKGNFQMTETWSRESFEMAIKYYQEAIQLDPEFAAAYSGLAYAYIELTGWHSNIAPSEEYRVKCQEAAMKALELNPDQAEAYISLGQIVQYYENDWNKANTYYNKGMELKPGASWVYLVYMNFLTWMGDFDKSISLGERLIEMDPLSSAAHGELIFAYYIARRDKEFIDKCMKRFVLHPDDYYTKSMLAMYYIDQREFEKAAVYAGISDSTEITIDTPSWMLILYGYYYGYAGNTAKAEECLNILNQQRLGMSGFSVESTWIYISLGKYDEALNIFEEEFSKDIKPFSLVTLKTHPVFDPLRDNPRFICLLDAMKFDEYKY